MKRINGIPEECRTPEYFERAKKYVLDGLHTGREIQCQSELDEMNLFEVARKKHATLFHRYEVYASLCRIGEEFFAYFWEYYAGMAQGIPGIPTVRIPMKLIRCGEEVCYISLDGAVIFTEEDVASYKLED